MYEDFLETILTYVKALNAADALLDSRQGGGPCGEMYVLGDIPVVYEGDVVGYLVDELGGAWSYREGPLPIPADTPPAPPKSNPDTIVTPVNPADMLRVDL